MRGKPLRRGTFGKRTFASDSYLSGRGNLEKLRASFALYKLDLSTGRTPRAAADNLT